MLERLISAALQRRWAVLVGMLMLAVAGVLSLRALNIDAFPDTTPVQVQINADAASLVPEEIERQITFPVELAMGGMPGLEEVRSISHVRSVAGRRDVSRRHRHLFRSADDQRAAGRVQMPPGVDRPEMGPSRPAWAKCFTTSLASDDGRRPHANCARSTIGTSSREMRTVPGTAEVNSWGGFEKQYQVRIDPTLLLKYDLTFEQVMQAVRDNNSTSAAATSSVAATCCWSTALGRTVNIEQIGNIVITAKDGVPIRVRDVAEVAIGHEIRRGAVTAAMRDPDDPKSSSKAKWCSAWASC